MEQQLGRPGGIFMIFRILMYLQYFPYIAIGLLVIAIVTWIIFAKKKLRWAKILAIILTVLVVITGALGTASLFFGRNLQQEIFPQRDFPEGGFQRDGERLRNKQNYKPDNESSSLEMELAILL
jgi:hypothetical protein